jgi:hypothetical protein
MVFIKELNKEIFPLYLNPLEDELFSSWLCRLSANHLVKTNTFIKNYFGSNIPVFNRDIDVLAPQQIIDKFIQHCPLNELDINNLFIKSLEGFAFENYRPNATIRNVLPVGIRHRTRKHFGQQCCPSCLSKTVPYFKKRWRLITSIICTDCNQFLIDRCFNCNSPITFFRVNMEANSVISTTNLKPLFLCSHCGQDLRNYNPVKYPNNIEIEYQRFIDDSICLGYNKVSQYSFTYIHVILMLALRLRSVSVKNRFREIVKDQYDVIFSEGNKEIRYWNHQERTEILPFVYTLLNDYPKSLSSLFIKGKIMKAYLYKNNDSLPYWFEKILYY